MITVIVIVVGVPNGPGKGEEGQWYFPPTYHASHSL